MKLRRLPIYLIAPDMINNVLCEAQIKHSCPFPPRPSVTKIDDRYQGENKEFFGPCGFRPFSMKIKLKNCHVFWHIAVFDESLSQNTFNVNEFLVSKETVVLRRWERSKTKIWFYQTS